VALPLDLALAHSELKNTAHESQNARATTVLASPTQLEDAYLKTHVLQLAESRTSVQLWLSVLLHSVGESQNSVLCWLIHPA
jgi:hypothetical protein